MTRAPLPPALLAAALAVAVLGCQATSAPSASTVAPATTPAATPATTTPQPTTTPESAPPSVASPDALHAIGHVAIIVMENQGPTAILGNPDAPYLNQLANQYGMAAGYTGVARPSQPNYFALFSGSTQGVTDDDRHDFTGVPTVADQIEAVGRSWHVAAENVPPDCYAGDTASGGADGEGNYARKHNPAISFTQISGDPARCASITDFSGFDPALGNYWLIAPNLCHDMHDCSISRGDAFLAEFLPRIIDSPEFRADGLVVVTFDEGDLAVAGGGSVLTILIGPGVKAAYRSDAAYDHYSLLRTIEDAWGMPCLAEACSATPLDEFFR